MDPTGATMQTGVATKGRMARRYNYFNQFFDACAQGDIATVEAMWADTGQAIDVNDVSAFRLSWQNWETPLSVASIRGHFRVVRWLVETAGADVNLDVVFTNTSSWSWMRPLTCACTRGHINIAKYLLSHGGILWPPRMTDSPLWAACRNGYLGIVRWLILDVDGVTIDRIMVGGRLPPYTPQSVRLWLTAFMQRRMLIAYWSDARRRRREHSTTSTTVTAKGVLWGLLPRQAMAAVLLMLMVA
jgi:hypothetical protein